MTKLETLAKYGTKVRKMLCLAFADTTPRGEAENAFLAAKTFMTKMKIGITEIIRPDWGGGPLLVALQQYGSVVLTSGSHEGETLTQVMEKDPDYVIMIHNSGGFRDKNINKAIAEIADAYGREMFCVIAGDWDNIEHGEMPAEDPQ